VAFKVNGSFAFVNFVKLKENNERKDAARQSFSVIGGRLVSIKDIA
jgi:uncharacterized protein with GYD domain